MKLTQILTLFILLTLPLHLKAGECGRVTSDFNEGWTFQLLDNDGNPGEAQSVRLPHDWAITGPFDTNPKTWGGQGKLPWRAVGVYSKTFQIAPEDVNKRVVFDFGGCMAVSEVKVNGNPVGGWDYGYLGFQADASPFLKAGENTITVQCDARKHGSRWYPGAGIYRPVRKFVCAREAWLPTGSVFVTTPEVTEKCAKVRVSVEPSWSEEIPVGAALEVVLRDPDGKIIEQKTVAPKQDATFEVPAPRLWDVNAPTLYSVDVSVVCEKVCDTLTVPFGIRSFEWTADDGFHLNGRRVQLYGVNLHHDQGILGAAAHPKAIERQLRIMKDMGVNAIRTSHNPLSPEFMDLCDRMGFIVWNELFDKWNATVDLFDQSKFYEFSDRQARQFVLRDRNHPCVFVWSIGNELADVERNERGGSNPDGDAVRRVSFLAECFRKYDPTRPVGMGCFVDGTCGPENHVRDSLDLTGWNYGAKYREARVRYPNMPLLYTESASAVSTRGYYELPHPKKKDTYNEDTLQVDGYDWVSASGPRDIPDVDFDRMEKDSYVAGEFVWTGFDYIGEPTPFDRQARSSYFGIVDLCGMPKDRFFLYRSYWNQAAATVHILPHWNWEAGQKVPVYVYANADTVELFLNGRSLGTRQKVKDVPEPVNLATLPGNRASASSEESEKGKEHPVSLAVDRYSNTRWCASSDGKEQWFQLELCEPTLVRGWSVLFELDDERYQYRLETSEDAQSWRTVYVRDRFVSEPCEVNLPADAPAARYFRVVFTDLQNGAWASIRDFVLSEEPLTDPDSALPKYYRVIDKYRFRWEDVPFEAGTLTAVAKRAGQEIGRKQMTTAGAPAKLRLTPETERLTGDDDLCYVLIESVDANGTLCPLDMRPIRVEVSGPADLAGLGNGNPMSFDVMSDAADSLFYGKAMLVLRSRPCGEAGEVVLTVHSDGIQSARVVIPR